MTKKPELTIEEPIHIPEIRMDEITLRIIGLSPLIMHRQSDKVRKELLFPRIKTQADKQSMLKHNPVEEFHAALYRSSDEAPTATHFPSGGFSDAIAGVAVDIPGAAKKAQMQRLTSVIGINVPIFGIPTIKLDVVRQSGMTRAPDVRTRPCFLEWACQITIRYYALLLNGNQIINLVQAAGQLRGIGDWRPEKGGSFGTFTVVNDDDPDFRRVVATQGKAAQITALQAPQFFDAESEDLVAWFEEERERRAPESTRTKKPKVRVIK